MSFEPITLAEGKLYALPLPIPLDGHVATHPIDSRGFATANCYLVCEPGHALLIDTGFSVHEAMLLDALDHLLEPSMTLTVWSVRMGEFISICNIRPVVERFNVDALYGLTGDTRSWVDFRPEYLPFGTPVGQGAMAEVEARVAGRGTDVPVGNSGRVLNALEAPLRLLPTTWEYDAATKTLFTADAFTYAWQPTPDGPWAVTAENDPTTPEQVWDYLIHSRYWWLPGASTAPIRQGIKEIFDSHDVEVIAPSFGCILRGREMVERHVALIDDLLARAVDEPSIGLEVGQWLLGGAP